MSPKVYNAVEFFLLARDRRMFAVCFEKIAYIKNLDSSKNVNPIAIDFSKKTS